MLVLFVPLPQPFRLGEFLAEQSGVKLINGNPPNFGSNAALSHPGHRFMLPSSSRKSYG